MRARPLATLLACAAVAAAVAACAGTQRVADLQPTVEYGGLWFADAGCATQFAMPRVIPSAELDEFARCIGSLGLTPSKRRHPLLDGAVFTYGGGLEVTARYETTSRGRRLMSIGFSGGRRPTIAPDVLESLRREGSRNPGLGDERRSAVLATLGGSREYAFVRLRVCIDEDGAVTSSVPLESSTPEVVGMLDDVSDWRFAPFVWNGSPRGVCAVVDRVFPPEVKRGPDAVSLVTEETPYPAVAPPVILRGDVRPVRGVPSRYKTIAAAVRYCIDERGRVVAMKVLHRSGVTVYDKTIRRIVSTWVFAPFLVHGQPARVCSVAVFGRSLRRQSAR